MRKNTKDNGNEVPFEQVEALMPFEEIWPSAYAVLEDVATATVRWINETAHNDYARNQMLKAIHHLLLNVEDQKTS